MIDELKDRLDILECDPLELSARIASGKPIHREHPKYKQINLKWRAIIKKIYKGQIDISDLNNFWEMVDTALTNSTPTLELQSKHILSLTEYLHAKRKAVENTEIYEHHESMETISDETLEALLRGEDVKIQLPDTDKKSNT